MKTLELGLSTEIIKRYREGYYNPSPYKIEVIISLKLNPSIQGVAFITLQVGEYDNKDVNLDTLENLKDLKKEALERLYQSISEQ